MFGTRPLTLLSSLSLRWLEEVTLKKMRRWHASNSTERENVKTEQTDTCVASASGVGANMSVQNNAVMHFWICSYTYVFVLGIGVRSSVNPWFLLPFSASISMSFYSNRGIWALQVDQDQQRSSSSLSLWGERGRPVYEPRNLLETTWHKNEVISFLRANQGSREQMILAVHFTVKPRLTVPHI